MTVFPDQPDEVIGVDIGMVTVDKDRLDRWPQAGEDRQGVGGSGGRDGKKESIRIRDGRA